MGGYYSERLSGERLRLCYEIAPPRVKQYLEAEIAFVLDKIEGCELVLELGCGNGRVLERLTAKTETAVGIDTSYESLRLASELLCNSSRCHLAMMDAAALGFRDGCFDAVVCIQNGISAFRVDQRKLIEEAVHVTRKKGTVLFSSYSERFWEDRLRWFRMQAERKLVGEIDEDATGNGVIVCKDGFKATTIKPEDFIRLTSGLPFETIITEVDDSSIFFELLIR
jgi:SAM-dependent methyltransferase